MPANALSASYQKKWWGTAEEAALCLVEIQKVSGGHMAKAICAALKKDIIRNTTDYLSKRPRIAKARALSEASFLQLVRNRNWSSCGSSSLCTWILERVRELQCSHQHNAQRHVPPYITDMSKSGQHRREANVMSTNN